MQLTYTLATQPVIPFFPAGFGFLPADFNSWCQAPLSFLTGAQAGGAKLMFRAELSSGGTFAANASTVIPFNSILEDPYGGWQAGSSQWNVPAGYTGTYLVAVTASCTANAAQPVLSAQVGVDSQATLYTVDSGWVPGLANTPGIVSGAVPVTLYGGLDSVQGLARMSAVPGTASTAAGSRCRMSICWFAL